MEPESRTDGQAPSRGKHKIDREAARALYLSGSTKKEISRALNCTREQISRIAKEERWDDFKSLNRTHELTGKATAELEDRLERLVRIDHTADAWMRRGDRLGEFFDRFLDNMARRKRIKPAELLSASKTMGEAARVLKQVEQLSRAAGGMGKTDGIVKREDQVLVVETRRLPAEAPA